MTLTSILIPTYARNRLLADTIQSLQGQEKIRDQVEILVIDNACLDQTHELIKSMQDNMPFPLYYVREPRPGLHFSRHRGALESRGEILIYIDDDIYAGEHWLEAHLRVHQDPNIKAVGGRVLPHWEVKPPEWVHLMPSFYLSLLDYGDTPRPIGEKEGINGCNYSIKREALFEAGGFHPDSFPTPDLQWLRGDGEAGLTKQILAAGGVVMYVPEATIRHRIPPERLAPESFRKRAFKHGIENGYILARRWKCAPWVIAAMIVGGTLLSKIYALIATRKETTSAKRILDEISMARFDAIAAYGRRLLHNQDLRNHVNKNNYLDEEL